MPVLPRAPNATARSDETSSKIVHQNGLNGAANAPAEVTPLVIFDSVVGNDCEMAVNFAYWTHSFRHPLPLFLDTGGNLCRPSAPYAFGLFNPKSRSLILAMRPSG